MSKNIITINKHKKSSIEFEVSVQGLGDTPPEVRFVLKKALLGMNLIIPCSRIGTKWEAKFPIIEDSIKEEQCEFEVEIIVDGYYFSPASGEIHFIQTPDVSFKPNIEHRPTVTTSFVVKEEEVEPPKRVVEIVQQEIEQEEEQEEFVPEEIVEEVEPVFVREKKTRSTNDYLSSFRSKISKL